ncbi:MAG: biotin carboxylase [Deltaproteobacteria bacterium]|nr:biotin carboxylase [Deltaproteobacteria bacterium]
MNFSNICVGVTGLNMTDSPAPGVAVMRCIKEGFKNHFTGIGFGYDSMDAGLYEKQFFKHVYLLPYPSEGPANLLERILKIHEKTPMDVIVPTLDAELFNFISIRKDLHKEGIMTFFPTREQFELCSKVKLHELGEKSNILVPKTSVEKELKKVSTGIEKIGFPLMVKGIYYDAYLAYSYDEVYRFARKIISKWGMPIILQKHVKGVELDVAALGDGKGGCIGYVPMRKLIITDKGKGWAAVTIEDKKIASLLDRFFLLTKWQGPVELEIIKKEESRDYYLIEINNRFPAWIYLAKAAGINLPYLTVMMAKGEPVKKNKSHKIGIIYNRGTCDLVFDMKQLEIMNMEGELHYE